MINSARNNLPQNLPSKFYHLTRPYLVENMQKCGKIMQGNCVDVGYANFLLDIKNFFSSWGKVKLQDGISLQEMLLLHAIKHQGEVSLLSIPSERLNTDLLFIRSQNKVFNTIGEVFDSLSKEEWQKFDETCAQTPYNKLRNIRRDLFESKGYECEEIFEGVHFSKMEEYEQQCEAFEVIYRDDIPFDAVESVSNLKISDIKSTLTNENFVQVIMNKLLGKST